MKQLILILICIFFVTACKKDLAASTRSQITGEWEYITFSGYPFIDQSLPAGNGRIIVFSKNGVFERKAHDTTVFRGRYTMQERKEKIVTAMKNIFFLLPQMPAS